MEKPVESFYWILPKTKKESLGGWMIKLWLTYSDKFTDLIWDDSFLWSLFINIISIKLANSQYTACFRLNTANFFSSMFSITVFFFFVKFASFPFTLVGFLSLWTDAWVDNLFAELDLKILCEFCLFISALFTWIAFRSITDPLATDLGICLLERLLLVLRGWFLVSFSGSSLGSVLVVGRLWWLFDLNLIDLVESCLDFLADSGCIFSLGR